MNRSAQCEVCHIGQVHPLMACYITRFGRQVLVASKVPAYSCDVCGRLFYDDEFLGTLYDLMNTQAGFHRQGQYPVLSH